MLSGAPSIVQGDGGMSLYQCRVCKEQYRGVTGCPQCRQNMDALENETNCERLEFVRAFYVQNRHARDARYENDVEYRSDQDCIDHAIDAFDKIEEACK